MTIEIIIHFSLPCKTIFVNITPFQLGYDEPMITLLIDAIKGAAKSDKERIAFDSIVEFSQNIRRMKEWGLTMPLLVGVIAVGSDISFQLVSKQY